MNLTNYRRTPVHRVVELIRVEAARYGVDVKHSELVGLIPQEALVDAAQWYLQLDQFDPQQILEYRLVAAQMESAGDSDASTENGSSGSLSDFLDTLASGEPTPGGGSAAAYSGAAGAALVAMVARLTIGRKKYAEVEDKMEVILASTESLRTKLESAVQRDADAYNTVMEAFRLPKETPSQKSERSRAIQEAMLGAAEVPLEVAAMAVDVMDLAQQAVELGNINAISDGATASALARAALSGAGYNVRINVLGLNDEERAQKLLKSLKSLEKREQEISKKIDELLLERGGFPEV